jgi:hypothetical protein
MTGVSHRISRECCQRFWINLWSCINDNYSHPKLSRNPVLLLSYCSGVISFITPIPSIPMSVESTLTGSALQASRAALSAAIADQESSSNQPSSAGDDSLEAGEIQEIEVDMQSQADAIRTVFSDPSNFNVKVRQFSLHLHRSRSTTPSASIVLFMDSLV